MLSRICIVCSLLAVFSIGSWAAENSAENSTVVYQADFFKRYQLVNAEDMLRRIPGLGVLLDADQQEKRGFGSSGDQILINSKRLAGKNNEIIAALQRIQSEKVERVELIRGTSSEVNVRSDGLIVNVVVSDNVRSVSSWKAAGHYYGDDHFNPELYFSYSGGENTKYFFSAELGQFYEMENKKELFSTPANVDFEKRREAESFDLESYELTANIIKSMNDGNELRINALLQSQQGKAVEARDRSPYKLGEPEFSHTEHRRNIEDSYKWELGFDYEHKLEQDKHLELLFFYSYKDKSSRQKQYDELFSGNLLTSKDLTDEVSQEIVSRSALSIPMTESQNMELGFEAAYNELDTTFAFAIGDGEGGTSPVDVFNPDSVVSELRGEFFVSHFWSPGEDISLESGLNVEYSEIEQDGVDVDKSRDFVYVKPRFDFRYNLSSSQQLRVLLERTVSQLDFAEFVSSFDNEDDSLDAGNPELEPEQAWELEVGYEYRLNNDQGVFNGKLFYRDIEDHLDKVAVGPLRSAPGNVADAKHYGMELESSLRLSALGYEDAVLSISYLYQDSKVKDPFTGQQRVIGNLPDHVATLGFRHDITNSKLAYGFEFNYQSEKEIRDIDFYDQFDIYKSFSLFIEKKLWNDIFVRIEANNIYGDYFSRGRQRGDMGAGLISRREYFDETESEQFVLSFRSSF